MAQLATFKIPVVGMLSLALVYTQAYLRSHRERTQRELMQSCNRKTRSKSSFQLHYAPGSPERKAVDEAIAAYRKQGTVEIPCIIGGKEVSLLSLST